MSFFIHIISPCFLNLSNFFLTIPGTVPSKWHFFYTFPTKIFEQLFHLPHNSFMPSAQIWAPVLNFISSKIDEYPHYITSSPPPPPLSQVQIFSPVLSSQTLTNLLSTWEAVESHIRHGLRNITAKCNERHFCEYFFQQTFIFRSAYEWNKGFFCVTIPCIL